MADKDKTDKIKTMIDKNKDKLTDIEDKGDELLEITSHLKWLGRDTKTTDEEDKEDDDDEEVDDCTGGVMEDCLCQKCTDDVVKRMNRDAKKVRSIRTEDNTKDDDDTEDDTDSDINNSDLAGEGFTTDDDE